MCLSPYLFKKNSFRKNKKKMSFGTKNKKIPKAIIVLLRPYLDRKIFYIGCKTNTLSNLSFLYFSCIFCCELKFYQWTLMLSTEILSFFVNIKRAEHWNLDVFQVNGKRAEHGNLEFFSGERKMCWALKSWVFPVNVKRSLSEPEKLKISGRSTFEWTWKNSRFQCEARLSEPEKPQDFSVKHVWVNQKNSRF